MVSFALLIGTSIDVATLYLGVLIRKLVGEMV